MERSHWYGGVFGLVFGFIGLAGAATTQNKGVPYDPHGFTQPVYPTPQVAQARPHHYQKVAAKFKTKIATGFLGLSFGPEPQAKAKQIHPKRVASSPKKVATTTVVAPTTTAFTLGSPGEFMVRQAAHTAVNQLPIAGVAGMAGGMIAGTTVDLMLTGLIIAVTEHREMGDGEACEELPLIPWLGGCKWHYKYDKCKHPESVNYSPHPNDGMSLSQRRDIYMATYCSDPPSQQFYVAWKKAHPYTLDVAVNSLW